MDVFIEDNVLRHTAQRHRRGGLILEMRIQESVSISVSFYKYMLIFLSKMVNILSLDNGFPDDDPGPGSR
jgi:hypothetical protein